MATKDSAGLEAFLSEAKQAYMQMFGEEQQAELKTFSQREVRVFEEGRRLSRLLLESHLTRDQGSPSETSDELSCPFCQQLARRVGEIEIRPVTTLVGDVNFARAKFKCGRCRKFFFST